MNDGKNKPDGELRVAVVIGKRVIRIGPRIWAVGAVAASAPQWRAVLNILESAVAGVVIYAVLTATSWAFDGIDQVFGGLGDILAGRIVRGLIVEGGLWGSAAWLTVALLATARLAAITTWRLFVPTPNRGGGDSE